MRFLILVTPPSIHLQTSMLYKVQIYNILNNLTFLVKALDSSEESSAAFTGKELKV
jgi:hypothetical protein